MSMELLSLTLVWPPFGDVVVPFPEVLTYTFTGPGTATVGIPSDYFTVQLAPGFLPELVRITPGDGLDGGTFTLAYVSVTNEGRFATFTYTPLSVGLKTISVTNNGGLVDPPPLHVLVSFPLPPDDLSGHNPVVELRPARTLWYRDGRSKSWRTY